MLVGELDRLEVGEGRRHPVGIILLRTRDGGDSCPVGYTVVDDRRVEYLSAEILASLDDAS